MGTQAHARVSQGRCPSLERTISIIGLRSFDYSHISNRPLVLVPTARQDERLISIEEANSREDAYSRRGGSALSLLWLGRGH